MKKLFDHMFPKKNKKISSIKTTPLSEEEIKEAVASRSSKGTIQLKMGFARSVGKQRDHNEDSFFSICSSFSKGETEQTIGLFIIADGMGGYVNGAAASSTAANQFGQRILQKVVFPMMDPKLNNISDSVQEVMQANTVEAHYAVQKAAPGGGTTLTAALVINDKATIAHVGDSRAYFIYADGRINKLTQDHSVVQRLVELGQLDEKDALIHPQRNVLYQALGREETFTADISTHSIPRQGYLMLCTDGLWGVIDENFILKTIASTKSLTSCCEQLVSKANDAGGPDNITVVLVHFSE